MATASIKLLKPRDGDLKNVGPEPDWRIQPETESRTVQIMRAVNWYNYNFGKKDAKEFLVDYLERNNRKVDAKKIKSAPDSAVKNTAGWFARMTLVGLQLNEHEELHLNNEIKFLKSLKEQLAATVKDDAVKPNIQDRLRDKAIEAAGELEAMYDEFCSADEVKLNLNNHKPMTIIRGMNVQPSHINQVRDPFASKVQELAEALEGKDAQLVEGYSRWGKNELKQMLKFCELVVADCDSYVQIKKVERKPRAKKKQTPDQVVRKLKYLQQFPELKLTSEPATKLADCAEFYTYDTAKRKLQHYVADSHVGSMTVKNNTIIGFDANLSVSKTLRKPAEQLKALFAGGKPGARKYFKEIKATDIKLNGRFNENLIILKVW
jgi:hypothetical protein